MRGESTSSSDYSKMSERADMCIKRYVYHLKDRSKLNCLIHGSGNYADECKVLETLVLSILKSGIIGTAGRSPPK